MACSSPPPNSATTSVGSPCTHQASKKARLLLQDPVDKLRALPTIRERCQQIYAAGQRGELKHFALHEDKIGEVVDYVQSVIEERFPGGMDMVPNHSRYRHFEPGNVDRLSQLRSACKDVDKREVARRLVDLVVVSVLLDAGAGDKWKYVEKETGLTIDRSEGLGVASFRMFMDGAFSSDAEQAKGKRLQADAVGLQALTSQRVREGFQVKEDSNPLVGTEGRAALLRRLGKALEEHPEFFSSRLASKGADEDGGAEIFRPGYLVDYLFAQANPGTDPASVPVHDLWRVVMDGLESIWPAGRTSVGGRPMGDVWPHSALALGGKVAEEGDGGLGEEKEAGACLVPFHKLSQWLTYSLMEPLAEAGLALTETRHMTGLPEYRNGGLFVDLGVLEAKRPELLDPAGHAPGSEVIVEWRALTVVLLDEVARRLREKLGASEKSLPLVKVLEGGTWTAGRKIAREKRPDSCGPPIVIVSDGTVF
ncbi:Protein of unknown function DUF1688 [Nannochloropsis gaditana]|uniref:Uracil catabolism protein 4 n=1 Tax=Nannochloropsis gaditana TaxID=72520 RepID=W7TK87_9STRA|nr:Protein of unknown function DUF1688 [Nannochloropsis gaditana]